MNAALNPVAECDTTTTIAEYSPTAAALADLRNKYAAVVYDVTSSKGMAAAKAARAELREVRVTLEATRKEIKAPALTRCRDIDSEAKRITLEIEALEDPIIDQIRKEEERKANIKAEAERIERERVEAMNARFDALRALPLQANGTADECRALIGQAEAFDPASFPEDMQPAAKYERNLAIAGLRAALDRIEQADADRAELERLRAAQAAVQAEADRLAQVERDRVAAEEAQAQQREQELRDQRIREEALEQAKQDAIAAEARRLQDAEQAIRDQAEAVRQAELRAAEQAAARERARQAVEQEEREAEEKRAANVNHRAAVNRKAAAALVKGGLSEDHAKLVITLVAQGHIPAASITY